MKKCLPAALGIAILLGIIVMAIGIVSATTSHMYDKGFHEMIFGKTFSSKEELWYGISETILGILMSRGHRIFVRKRECVDCGNKTKDRNDQWLPQCYSCGDKAKEAETLRKASEGEPGIICPVDGHQMELQLSGHGLLAHQCPSCKALYFSPKLAKELMRSIRSSF